MRRAIHRSLSLCLLLFVSASLFAQDNLWSDADNYNIRQNLSARGAQAALPTNYRLFKLNSSLAKQLQSQAPVEGVTARVANLAIPFSMPLPEGKQLASKFFESPIMSRQLQRVIPGVKTYELTDAGGSSLGRLTMAPEGITGLLFTDKGAVYISPAGKEYPDVHMVYYIKDVKSTNPVVCAVKEKVEALDKPNARVTAGDCQMRTYRLAVAAAAEYTTWSGGTQATALAAITVTVNNVNAIYGREAAIQFTLVTNNSIIYTDPVTDPYGATLNGALITANNTFTNTNLGAGNYDIGIVFNNAWNGGLAQLQSTCGVSKGRSAAGLTFGQGAIAASGPQGPIFDVTVAHEIAHQMGATHTFMAEDAGCAGNPQAITAMEPGGGSTIMAYAGVCDPNAYQSQSDHYFHIVSLVQMTDFVMLGAGSTCDVPSATGNAAPDVTVPAATYTIPASTPFELTSSATDADGNTLQYNWEQIDAGTPSTIPPDPTNTVDPMFRSVPPNSSPNRVFPRMVDLLFALPTPYEVLPSVSRTMSFAVTVRDNAAGGGCTDEEGVDVITEGTAGPFVVTSQPGAVAWTANGTNTENITWNVANTDLAPINCPNVDILFSIDGGFTYPYVLAAATPNDGTHTITVPNLPTETGRIRIQASNNVFFNINAGNISIASACAANGVTVAPASDVTGAAGSPSLDLSLSAAYGTPVTISGSLQSSDTHAFLPVNYNTPGVCAELGNAYRHDTYRFMVNVSGTYTFTRAPAANIVMNLYLDAFNPGTPCQNFIASSGTFDDQPPAPQNVVILSANLTATLAAGVYYTLVFGTFSNTQPALPHAYTVSVTPPAGGGIFTGPTNPGAGFSYTFVVVNNTTGNIVAIDPGANLSNAGTFPTGDYTIWGLSYSDAIAPATLNAFIGGPFSALQNATLFQPGTVCSQLSQNSIAVDITGSLPAEMLPLKAAKLNNSVQLKWGTLNEQNTSHFEVMRSTDGANFETLIGNVPASGNSNSQVNYNIIDQNPANGINYYRLKQVDLDGRSTLSNVAVIDITLPFTLAAVYPNPAKATLTLEYITEKAGAVNVIILDSKGAVVKRSQFNAQSGRNIRNFQVSGLAKGIYAIQITGSDRTTTQRFIKE
jgi:hypothetical protein